jgi:TolB protein
MVKTMWAVLREAAAAAPQAALLGLLGLGAGPAVQARPISFPHQLTYSQNMDTSLAPDGKRLVYISVIEGHEQFFVMNADGTNSRQLTRDAADHEDPAWSPDGRKIAFSLVIGDHKQIVVMNPNGTDQRAVTPASQSAIHPGWSPDSRQIIYCTDDDLRPPVKNESVIYSIDVASGKVTPVISGGVNTAPVISPDGRKIAFRRMVDTNSELFIANRDGSGAHNITNHPAFDAWPSWSPDGSWLAFASNRNSSYQIFVMRPDGSDVRLVANTNGRATSPRWSPSQTEIYFTNCDNKDLSVDCEIFVAPVDLTRSR